LRGVRYVEFSVGGELLDPRFYGVFKSGVAAAARLGVRVRFLLGFNREKIRPVTAPATRSVLGQGPEDIIDIQIEPHLDRLRRFLDSEARRDDLVVGFDVMGSELGYPYTPFLDPAFIDALRILKKDNPNFGVRIHVGEDTYSVSAAEWNSPFVDPYRALLGPGIGTAYELIRLGFRNVRLGHEIGLESRRRMATFLGAGAFGPLLPLRDIEVFSPMVPSEVNLTSNYFLCRSYNAWYWDMACFRLGADIQAERLKAGGARCGTGGAGSLCMDQHPVVPLLKKESKKIPWTDLILLISYGPGGPRTEMSWECWRQTRIVFGTDDSGSIRGLSRWDTEGKVLPNAFTLGGEFCRAIDHGIIDYANVSELAKNSIICSFAQPDLRHQLFQRLFGPLPASCDE
jgi:hypothetical protein